MKRHQILKELIKYYGYDSYLEIGVANEETTYNKIPTKVKRGIEPNHKEDPSIFQGLSDYYFIKHPEERFDLIFIDGFHEHQQVLRDVNNSLKILNEGGTIMCHDCNPQEKEEEDFGSYGTCWRAFVELRFTRPDLEMYTVDLNCGCGIIQRGSQEILEGDVPDFTFDLLEENRKEWLNLMSWKEFTETKFK